MDLGFLADAGPLGLFILFALYVNRQHQKSIKTLTNQHQNYIESRDLIIAEIFASQSKRDQEGRDFLLARDEDQRNFWLQMRSEYNSTLADNTAVMHKVIEVVNRSNKLFEDLNR